MNQPKVSIIDYDLGNIYSVVNVCEKVGLSTMITNDVKKINTSDALILPGVGAYKEAMNNLKNLDLIYPIRDFAQSGKIVLGVCLGMQLLTKGSEEFGNCEGIGLFEGVCKSFKKINNSLKTPFIGWNEIRSPKGEKFSMKSPLKNTNCGENMYFVHSFFVDDVDDNEVLSSTHYNGFEYCSAMHRGNIYAFQFHPEKSGIEGIKIYQELKNIINSSNQYGNKT